VQTDYLFWTYADRSQVMRELVGAAVQFAVSQALGPALNRQSVGIRNRVPADQLRDTNPVRSRVAGSYARSICHMGFYFQSGLSLARFNGTGAGNVSGYFLLTDQRAEVTSFHAAARRLGMPVLAKRTGIPLFLFLAQH
jgi:hypothetical protein